MKRWPTKSLSEVATCLDSQRIPVKEGERKLGHVPYYGANGQVGWIDKPIFNEPLLLVAEDGGHFDEPERGVAYTIRGPSWINNHAHALRLDESKVLLDFLNYHLRHFDFKPYITGTTSGVKVAYCLALTFCILTFLIGALAILMKDNKTVKLQRVSNAARVLAETLGSPRILYSVVIGFAVFAFHAKSPKEFGWIVTAWVLTALLSPLEGSVKIGRRLQKIFKPNRIYDADGLVVAYQTPNLILVRQSPSGKISSGDVVAVHDPLGHTRLALALDHVGRDEGVLLRTIEIADVIVPTELDEQLSSLLPNSVVCVSAPDSTIIENRLVKMKGALVGLVAPETSVEKLFFEVVKDKGLEEGRLVEVQIGKRAVTYQLVNGLTKEEIVQQKNTHGFARAQAQKIGEWDTATKRFKLVKWLPAPNAPVLLKKTSDFKPNSSAVGHFPGTDYPVSIKSIDELVTHNTAILGILGVGKSMLAIELVERMIATGIKVICLDLTNQYADELAEFYDVPYEAQCLSRIEDAGEKDRNAWADNPEEGGSITALREAIFADLTDFLREDTRHLAKTLLKPAQT